MGPAHTRPIPTSDPSPRRAVVVTGGGELSAAAAGAAVPATVVVAADSGLDHARRAGIVPDVLVGDLDSISPAGRAWAQANVPIERHDPDKSATDTELAISTALAHTVDALVVVAGDGDRLDHQLGTIGAAARAAAEHQHIAVTAWIGATCLHFVTPSAPVTLSLPVGTTFSVLALGGNALGVTITGARWPLTEATVAALSGLGISNVAVADPVVIALAIGIASVVVPAFEDPSHHGAT